jgi:hypothetical protein
VDVVVDAPVGEDAIELVALGLQGDEMKLTLRGGDALRFGLVFVRIAIFESASVRGDQVHGSLGASDRCFIARARLAQHALDGSHGRFGSRRAGCRFTRASGLGASIGGPGQGGEVAREKG